MTAGVVLAVFFRLEGRLPNGRLCALLSRHKPINMNSYQAYKAIIRNCDTSRGAPMGRANVGSYPETIVRGNGRICKCDQVRVYTRRVPLIEGYDSGGAYWGVGKPLYVEYTKDLSFVNFYRI